MDFYISSMSVRWSFDAKRFCEAVHLDELDAEARLEMPGIADKPLISFQDKTPYPEIEATLQCTEISGQIASEIEIQQVPKKFPLAYIAEKGLVGHVTINAIDPTGRSIRGQEWKTPILSLQIHQDVDCQLIGALRNSFRATRSTAKKPRLRIFLTDKLDASVASLLDDTAVKTAGINEVLVWETWG